MSANRALAIKGFGERSAEEVTIELGCDGWFWSKTGLTEKVKPSLGGKFMEVGKFRV